MGKIGKGEWKIQTSTCGMNKSQNKKDSIGNIVNGPVIVWYGDGW